jgi:hypothetical protein
MNSHLYHWHAEQMVRHEMHEIDRAVEQAHLLREAGLSHPDRLTRLLNHLSNLLKERRKNFREQTSMDSNSSPRRSPRSA